MMTAPSWTLRTRPRPEATVRLFCLPSAGYGAAMYRDWGVGLPEHIEVCAITLPGRETLLRLPPETNLQRLVTRIAEQIDSLLDRPFALFGHSYGSWLAFELARALRRSGKPAPQYLFVSARRAPTLKGGEAALHTLDDTTLIAEIQRRYGGIPEAVLREPELLTLLVPALRADLQSLETYECRTEEALTCPIAAYGGVADPIVPLADLEAWQQVAAGGIEVRQFPGAHFYLQRPSKNALLTTITTHLARRPQVREALASGT